MHSYRVIFIWLGVTTKLNCFVISVHNSQIDEKLPELYFSENPAQTYLYFQFFFSSILQDEVVFRKIANILAAISLILSFNSLYDVCHATKE
jgi:hypothetical protein